MPRRKRSPACGTRNRQMVRRRRQRRGDPEIRRVRAPASTPSTRRQRAPARRYVKTDVRELIEDMVGKRKPFSAGLPWLYIFVSSAGAILEDLVDFATFYRQFDNFLCQNLKNNFDSSILIHQKYSKLASKKLGCFFSIFALGQLCQGRSVKAL